MLHSKAMRVDAFAPGLCGPWLRACGLPPVDRHTLVSSQPEDIVSTRCA